MASTLDNSVTPRGVYQGRGAAVRVQRAMAAAVVLVPFAGAALALALLPALGWGLVEAVSLVSMYVLCMLGITVGFHRYFAHRSFNTSRAMEVILAVLGSMAVQGPLLFWVATHRRHHAYSDRPGDPHSPHVDDDSFVGMFRGLWHAHVGWMFSAEATDWTVFARDCLNDRTLYRIHRSYLLWVAVGLALPAVVAGWATGSATGAWRGFLWGGLVRIFLVNHASWCVGSVCHMFGRRPFETHDHSVNNFVVAVLAFGEGLQNNHHAFPGSAAHALRWWQPDLSLDVLRLLALAGLVWNVNRPTEKAIAVRRRLSPSETARAPEATGPAGPGDRPCAVLRRETPVLTQQPGDAARGVAHP